MPLKNIVNPTEQKLKFSIGNATKLGYVATTSREAGPSCPSSCVHFDKDCYAMKTQKRYPNALRAWRHNLQISDWQQYRAFFIEANKKNVPVRLNVSGDFIKKDSLGRENLDIKYLNCLLEALKSIKKENRPRVWLYTHVADKRILKLRQYGVTVFASIDNDKMLKKFKSAGFTNFAYNSDVKKGKSPKKYEERNGQKIPVCFEQLGTKKDCASCNYCIDAKPGQDIVFLNH